ncbi:ABC transporter permease [Corynebacterium mendelii]|uniref:ABC transporter permease n=1 Tax=Corynebacterium mendelii TaxID=2765362 RepID=A0A939IUU1_9CORY|nr:ABC transporter permease [Corynebacterium mendelii]MBN9645304.1 ABC transporter permease [Corynebacterium mendelii]
MIRASENPSRSSSRGATEAGELKPVIGRPPLRIYLRQLWQRRYFILAESRAKAFSQTRNMLLGHVWLILSPLLDAAVYGLIFGLLLKTSRGIDYFVLYLFVGITFFGMISQSVGGAVGLIRSRKNIIKAFSFPRAALVLSFSLRQVIDAVPQILVAALVVAFFPNGPGLHPAVLLSPFVYLLMIIFDAGLSFFSAWLSDIIPDAKIPINYAIRFWFFASGIFFNIDHFIHDSMWLKILHSNPGYIILDMMRGCLIYGKYPPQGQWVLLTVIAVSTFIIGFLCFWSREVKYSRG